MTSGDSWVRKNFPSTKTFSYILCTVFSYFLRFICFSSTHKAQDILYFCSFRGILKAFSSFIWKILFFAVLFSGILMMIIPKKVSYAWFSSSCLCLSRTLTHFINVQTFCLSLRRENEAFMPSLYTIKAPHSPKNLNNWFLIYVLRVLN